MKILYDVDDELRMRRIARATHTKKNLALTAKSSVFVVLKITFLHSLKMLFSVCIECEKKATFLIVRERSELDSKYFLVLLFIFSR